MMKRPLALFAVWIIGITAAEAAEVSPLPVEIKPADPLVRYIGRFDPQDAAGPRCAWSASGVVLNVSGGSVNVKMSDSGRNHWQVLIDGTPTNVLALQKGAQLYSVASNLPAGEHTVELIKRTEANCGTTQLQGFQISEGSHLMPVSPAKRRIEVIGDSISCGYGNEAPSEKERFSPATENATKAYGAIAARDLGADYVCIAWSGKKLWPDNTITALYDLTLPNEPGSAKWDFQPAPDVVVINLGTNDFGRGTPEEKGWVSSYVEFIKRIRSAYPKTRIYLATGSMLSDAWPAERKNLTTVKGYITKAIAELGQGGESNVASIDFAPQNKDKDGLGADWHPSVKTHQVMAEKLKAVLKNDLGW